MAKQAKTNKTEQEALDAVEEALSIEFSDADISDEDLKALEEKLSDVTSELRVDTEGDAQGNGDDKDEAQPSIADRLDASARDLDDLDFPDAPPAAANDAHEAEIAGILYSFRQQPKSRIFFWTAVLSLVWLAACAYYGYVAVLPGLESPITLAKAVADTNVVILILVAFLPLLPVWSFAFLLRRAHEMRHAARSMMEAALRLLQPEKVATGSVTTVGNAIRREVAAIGDGVERAIARAGELEFMVQKEVMSLERSYGDSEMRLKRLVDDISNEREEVITHADKLRSSIANTQTEFTADIDAAGGKIEEQIKTLTDMLNQSLSERGHSITTQLSERSNEFITLLEQSGKQVEEKLNLGKEELGSEVTRRAREISEVIGLSGQAVANLMESRFAQIQTAEAEISSKLEAGRMAFDETLEARKSEIASVLGSANQSINGLLESGGAALAEQSNLTLEKLEASRLALRDEMTEQTSQLQASSQQAANALANAAETGAESFGARSEKVLSQIEDSLAVRAGDFENRIAEVGSKIDTELAAKIEGIDSTLTTSGSNLVSALGMRTEALGKVLQERTNAIGDTIASRLSGFGEQMTGHVDTAVTKLSEQTASLYESTKSAEQSILERTKRIEDVIRDGDIRLETTAEKSAQVAKEAAEVISVNMKSAEEQLNASIATGAKGFVATVDEKQGQLGKVIDEKQEQLGNLIETSMSALDDKITEKTTNLASKLNQGAHRISTELEDKSRSAIEKMEENVRTLENRLKAGSEEISAQFTAGNDVLDERLASGKENLLQSVAQSVADAGNAIDDKASKISTLLNERAKLINDTLGTTLVETQRKLEDKTGEFTSLLREQSEGLVDLIENQAKPAFDGKTAEFDALLRERTAELRALIDKDAKPIVGALEQAGEDISARLSGLSNTIATDANTLFESLNQSSGSLEQLVASSTQNLDALQSQLALQASNFVSVVGESTTEMQRTQAITSDIENRIQSMSDGIAQNMAAISERLDAQGSTLTEATRLIDNAQNNLHGTLEAKQAGLEELARGLVSHSDEINRTMQTFGGAISELVDDVTQRSRGVGNTVAAEISSSIDDATARFTDAVEAMRGAAATMRVELEETREQMRRGVLELPDETAQNANAMRRVVTDQIAALRDLSAIVEQSGKMLDTVQPAAPAPQAPPVAPRAPAPQSYQAPAPRNRAPFPPVTSAPQSRPAPTQKRPQPTPAPAEKPGNSEAGWVSDLLKRASNESEPAYQRQPQPDSRAPHHVVDSLNSLSMDIANAIDHETSVDLWERYQRGETNVFTRRLYTLQGQQTFDEIRSKFSSDREFRGAVERYIDDFERLLQDASRNDPSGAMAQSYLNSDTGKVYTMLAHASGRLGS